MSYSPLVERLGFDENFMDVTQMVDMRLAELSNVQNVSFEGHIYNHCGECPAAYIRASETKRAIVRKSRSVKKKKIYIALSVSQRASSIFPPDEDHLCFDNHLSACCWFNFLALVQKWKLLVMQGWRWDLALQQSSEKPSTINWD